MAAKVSKQDIADAGFRAEQFGTPKGTGESSWDGAGGYLERIIARAEAWARGRLGSVAYDAAPLDTPRGERLRSAELCWVSAQLWKRRAAYLDSNAVSSRESMIYLDRREYESQATRAFECAEEQMQYAIQGEDAAFGSAVAFAHVETGPYRGSDDSLVVP
ncbi:hypothetical protein DYQ93_11425 [Xanthomonas sp. LMG 8992]|uniref:hypothetical protein n=1 Tax=Xanthomonas sp. LMG 8992 TaxID=1591157 RepID=UPI00137058D3|nr:hypothetical protein [Xanthomonas sp. LMG 8992]MXV11630.1 hypothetical protein [Xanthomonas sp. LMG 8992]